MEVIETQFAGLKIILPKIWKDNRGYFYESFQKERYTDAGINLTFCQDNEAFSEKGVIRGLHYQKGSSAQGKLVRVITGEVLDVVVDLRKNQPTYGKTMSVILNDIGKKQLYVPPGFAHGYAVLSDSALFSYKCTSYYHKEAEAGINPLDPKLKIDWLLDPKLIKLSDKDLSLPPFGKHEDIL